MGIFQATILEWAAVSFSRGSDLPDPGNKPESPAFQEDSLRFHHLGRPRGQTSSLKKTLSLSRNWGSFYKQEGEGPIVVKAECSKVVPASLPLHPEHKGATPESGQVQSTRLLQQCRPPALGGRGVQAADHMVAT